MSVKAMGLVWDLECPKMYGDVAFKHSHKYVLIAYADHADHHGKNIYPAVSTISRKTGLDERSVQRLTNDLKESGLLIQDGQGPKGTNRFRLPYNEGGDKLTPLSICRGDESQESLGDIPSGDIPSGVNLSPELKEPEPIDINNIDAIQLWEQVFDAIKPDLKGNHLTYVRGVKPVSITDGVLTLGASDELTREWLQDRLTSTVNRLLIGILKTEAAGVVFEVDA